MSESTSIAEKELYLNMNGFFFFYLNMCPLSLKCVLHYVQMNVVCPSDKGNLLILDVGMFSAHW